MGVQIDQPPRPRDRRVIRCLLRKPDAHKLPKRQRIGKTPCDPSLAVDALEVPDQQRPKVNPRSQARPPVARRIELPAESFDKLAEPLPVKKLIQPLVKRMTGALANSEVAIQMSSCCSWPLRVPIPMPQF
jgi:hypothetical protein